MFLIRVQFVVFFEYYKRNDPVNLSIRYYRIGFLVSRRIYIKLFYIDILASSCKKAQDIHHVFFAPIRQRWGSLMPNLKNVVLRGETGPWI